MAWRAVPLLRPGRDGGPRLSPGQALDDGGVNHGAFPVRRIRDGIEKLFEHIASHPVAIPLEEGVPAAKRARQIAPRAAGPRDPQHRFDKAAVIRAAAPGVRRLPQAMRLHLCPLGISWNIAIHPRLDAQKRPWKKLILNRP